MKTFFSLFFISFFVALNGQEIQNNEHFDFHFKNLSFIKDNEYFNLIADGYTLFGDKMDASISYSSSKKYKFILGFQALKNFGDNDIDYIQPVVSLHIYSGNNHYIFGKLETENSHFFPAPLYDFERLLNRKSLEYGIQHLFKNKHLQTDTWLEWEHFIYKGDKQRERLNFGQSTSLFIDVNDKIKLNIPIELFLHHRGGQINLRNEENQLNNAMVLMNAGIGFNPEYHSEKNMFGVDFQYFINRLNTDNVEELHFKKGSAFWLQLKYKSKYFQAQTGYWKSHRFVSAKGDDMYQTYSRRTEIYLDHNNQTIPVFSGYTEPNRSLLTFQLSYHKKLFENLLLDTRFNGYFQLNSSEINVTAYHFVVADNHFDYSIGLYLTFLLDKNLSKN